MKLWWTASEIHIVMTGHLLKKWLLSWLANDSFAFTYWPVEPTLILHVRPIIHAVMNIQYLPSRFLVTQHVDYISGRLCMNCSLKSSTCYQYLFSSIDTLSLTLPAADWEQLTEMLPPGSSGFIWPLAFYRMCWHVEFRCRYGLYVPCENC